MPSILSSFSSGNIPISSSISSRLFSISILHSLISFVFIFGRVISVALSKPSISVLLATLRNIVHLQSLNCPIFTFHYIPSFGQIIQKTNTKSGKHKPNKIIRYALKVGTLDWRYEISFPFPQLSNPYKKAIRVRGFVYLEYFRFIAV